MLEDFYSCTKNHEINLMVFILGNEGVLEWPSGKTQKMEDSKQ